MAARVWRAALGATRTCTPTRIVAAWGVLVGTRREVLKVTVWP